MTRPHAKHPAQLDYRAACKAADAADAALEAADCNDAHAMRVADVRFDLAWVAEAAAADALIRWAWDAIKDQPGAADCRTVVEAALAGRREARARMIDLADQLAV